MPTATSTKNEVAALLARASQMMEQAKVEIAPFFADGGRRWEIPDRKIAMRYLIDVVKGGMAPKMWAQLHPQEWARLAVLAPRMPKGEA